MSMTSFKTATSSASAGNDAEQPVSSTHSPPLKAPKSSSSKGGSPYRRAKPMPMKSWGNSPAITVPLPNISPFRSYLILRKSRKWSTATAISSAFSNSAAMPTSPSSASVPSATPPFSSAWLCRFTGKELFKNPRRRRHLFPLLRQGRKHFQSGIE